MMGCCWTFLILSDLNFHNMHYRADNHLKKARAPVAEIASHLSRPGNKGAVSRSKTR